MTDIPPHLQDKARACLSAMAGCPHQNPACPGCKTRIVAQAMQEAAMPVVEALQAAEWGAYVEGTSGCCPVCSGGLKEERHRKGCVVGAALEHYPPKFEVGCFDCQVNHVGAWPCFSCGYDGGEEK